MVQIMYYTDIQDTLIAFLKYSQINQYETASKFIACHIKGTGAGRHYLSKETAVLFCLRIKPQART